jgi:hypothetical protein
VFSWLPFFVLSVLPVSTIAQAKQKGDSAELTAQELLQKACGPRDQQANFSVGHGCNKITLMAEDEGIARVATAHPSTCRIQ